MKTPSAARKPSGKLLHSFVVIADTHVNESDHSSVSPFANQVRTNDRARFVFTEIASLTPRPQFIVHLGDVVHPVPGLSSHEVAIARYKEISGTVDIPIYVVPGNHDVGDKSVDGMPAAIVSDANLEVYRRAHGPDYFALDAGPMRLLIVNAQLLNSGLASEASQAEWFDAQLADCDRRVFVFLHYPPYLLHEAERSTYDNIDQPGRSWLLKRLKHDRVEAVFAGHVHNFWYDVVGNAEMYLLPSTAFLRHDFTEMYRIAPGPENGRDEIEKFGYLIVDVYERGHVARLVRTYGQTLAAGQAPPGGHRVAPVHTKTSPLAQFGVELRHAWAEIVHIPATGGPQEFGRKPARNDYQLMALWEMGVRTLKIPVQDIDDPNTLRRAQLMSDVGHDFVITSLGIPAASIIEQIVESRLDVSAIEINVPISKAVENAKVLAALRERSGTKIVLAHLRGSEDPKFDGKHFNHFVNAGMRPDELNRHGEAIDSLLDRRAIDGVTVRLDWATNVPATATLLDAYASRHRCELLASVKLGVRNYATANNDDAAIAALAAQIVAVSCCSMKVRYVFDTFMDVDRGYFPRRGFIDRRFNPRLAANVVSSLCAAFEGGDVMTIVRADRVGDATIIEMRSRQSHFILVSGDCEGPGSIASYYKTCPHVLNLATGEVREFIASTATAEWPEDGSSLVLMSNSAFRQRTKA